MSTENKAENTKDKILGRVKEAVGGATKNRDLEAEGRGQQSKGDLKQAGEKVKDAFK